MVDITCVWLYFHKQKPVSSLMPILYFCHLVYYICMNIQRTISPVQSGGSSSSYIPSRHGISVLWHWLLRKWLQTWLLPCVMLSNVFCWLLNSNRMSCCVQICIAISDGTCHFCLSEFCQPTRIAHATIMNCKFLGLNESKSLFTQLTCMYA